MKCCILLFLFATSTFAQSWEQIAQFSEGPIASMHFVNDSLGFIGIGSVYTIPAKGAIYRTTNAGTTWVKSTTPPASVGNVGGVFDITMTDAQNGWAAIWNTNSSLWRTKDGGRSWFPVDCEGTHGTSVRQTTNALIKTDLFAKPQLSFDSGASFFPLDVNTPNDGTLGLAFTDDLHGVMTRYRNGGFWERTTNGGQTWIQTQEAVESWSVYAVPNTSIMYTCEEGNSDIPAAQRNSKVRRSTDHGETWTRIADLPMLSTGHITGVGEDDLFMQTDLPRLLAPGVYWSRDKGVTWKAIGGPRSSADHRFVAFGSECNSVTVLAADDEGKLYRWRSRGITSGTAFSKNFGTVKAAKGQYANAPVGSGISSSLDLDTMLFIEAEFTVRFDTNSLKFDVANPAQVYLPPTNWLLRSANWSDDGLKISIANFIGAPMSNLVQDLGTLRLLVSDSARPNVILFLRGVSLTTKFASYSFCDDVESGSLGRIQVSDAGVSSQLSLPYFQIVPNPSSGKITFEFGDYSSGERIEIINVQGIIVLDAKVPSGSNKMEAQLPAGSYIARLRTGTEIIAIGRFEIVQ